MFERLYNTVVDICLVEGVQIPQGWGEVDFETSLKISPEQGITSCPHNPVGRRF